MMLNRQRPRKLMCRSLSGERRGDVLVLDVVALGAELGDGVLSLFAGSVGRSLWKAAR